MRRAFLLTPRMRRRCQCRRRSQGRWPPRPPTRSSPSPPCSTLSTPSTPLPG
uniref:Inner membrane protein n=1 Tax=Arundo donax TaxID=35708 RepID=A0A0A9HJI9_ARUDO